MYQSNSIKRVCLLLLLVFTLIGPCTYSMAVEDFGGSKDISQDDQYFGDWVKQQRGMTSEQLNTASQTLSPITNIIGYAVGGVVVLLFASISLITVLDLLYISIPPIRGLLYTGGEASGGVGGMGMGGMGGFGSRGGYGMGMGGFGSRGGYGMGMGGMGMGASGGAQGGAKPRQWVSDEAVQCAAFMGTGQQQQQGEGMGMMGGMGGQQQQQQQSTGSVITMYLKKRVVFLVLLAVSAILLTSSALLGTGANLAQAGIKLINMLNGYIPH